MSLMRHCEPSSALDLNLEKAAVEMETACLCFSTEVALSLHWHNIRFPHSKCRCLGGESQNMEWFGLEHVLEMYSVTQNLS